MAKEICCWQNKARERWWLGDEGVLGVYRVIGCVEKMAKAICCWQNKAREGWWLGDGVVSGVHRVIGCLK